ncbi:twin-arginine translocation signal domain-containing protein [Bradyrhizobium liaoningense]|uniref:twin-arginine translocation signal domain-containing protein n=1 Tax=Bradyrhizobium liaoningense TaxID=43992 RepID=UPI001BA965BA|nr:twin-arginine translocation signal domain-containing protein [Bradyrhizobium liaoningense]MBR0718823.1 twin-arginine translocation signal domain-containing protein [Bradyrhizobium liaoningense]
MERRDFLKLALGVAAASAALAASAQAVPLTPQPIEGPGALPRGNPDARPAVTSSEEAAELKPEQVRWHGRGHHWGWHRRHWGWRHRHWGWRRRHWRRHWRRRYWY